MNVQKVEPTPVVTQQAPKQNWKDKQAQQQKGCRLDGLMDLSVRVGHLNGLYEQGAINDEEYNKRAEALHVAKEILDCCVAGNTTRLKEILAENPNLDLNNVTENESTLLHISATAVRQGKSKPAVLQILLENRIQVDKKKDGQSALLTICDRSNFKDAAECAKILTSFGADARASATIKGKGSAFSCVSAIIASGGAADVLEVILKAGGNPNDTCDPHGPVLNYCIIEGFEEHAKVLINNGADPNSKELENGACALASAINGGYVDIIKLLLSRNVNVHAPIMRDQKVSCKELSKYMLEKTPNGPNVRAIATLFGH
jgi:ankyrin repeat protein